jgi:hypothetical protein
MAFGTPYSLGTASSGAGADTLQMTVAATSAAGDAIIVGASINSTAAAASPSACADSQGNIYSLVVTSGTGAEYQGTLFVATKSSTGGPTTPLTSGTDTITVTYSTSTAAAGHNLQAMGCSGIAVGSTATTVDQSAFNGNTTTGTTLTATLPATAQSDEMVVCLVTVHNTANSVSWNGPLTQVNGPVVNASNQNGFLAAGISTTAASTAYGGTVTQSGKWECVVLSLKPLVPSMTVTATQGGTDVADGMLLRVIVLDNAAAAASQTGGTLVQSGPAEHQGTLTPTGTGSFVFGAIIDNDAATQPADSGDVAIDNVVDATNGVCYTTLAYGSAYPGSLSTTTASSGITFGSITSYNGGIAAAEIIASGTLAVDASSPAVADTTTATTITSPSFSPPSSCLLVALVASDGLMGFHGVNPLTVTITDSVGLTWVNLATANTTGNGLAGVWVAQYPASTATTLLVTGGLVSHRQRRQISRALTGNNLSCGDGQATGSNGPLPHGSVQVLPAKISTARKHTRAHAGPIGSAAAGLAGILNAHGPPGTAQPSAALPHQRPHSQRPKAWLGSNYGTYGGVLGPANAHGPAGAVQPRSSVPVPRRKSARALAGNNLSCGDGQAGPPALFAPPPGTTQPQPTRQPRRMHARVLWAGTVVRTANAVPGGNGRAAPLAGSVIRQRAKVQRPRGWIGNNPGPYGGTAGLAYANGTVPKPAQITVKRRTGTRVTWRVIHIPAVNAAIKPNGTVPLHLTVARRGHARAVWHTNVIVSTSNVSGTQGSSQPRAAVPVPRRTHARAVWKGAGIQGIKPPGQHQPLTTRQPRRTSARAVWHFLLGKVNQHGPAGSAQKRATVAIPRRAHTRAWVGGSFGPYGGIIAPANAHGPYGTAPRHLVVARRAAARAVWRHQIGTANKHGPTGQSQPKPTVAIPRRTHARAVTRWVTGPANAHGPAGIFRPRGSVPLPRRYPARASWRGTRPVTLIEITAILGGGGPYGQGLYGQGPYGWRPSIAFNIQALISTEIAISFNIGLAFQQSEKLMPGTAWLSHQVGHPLVGNQPWISPHDAIIKLVEEPSTFNYGGYKGATPGALPGSATGGYGQGAYGQGPYGS